MSNTIASNRKIFMVVVSAILILGGAGCVGKSSQENILARKVNCAEAAQNFEITNRGQDKYESVEFFRYCYSPRLNTCIAESTELEMTDWDTENEGLETLVRKGIVDTLSGQVLVEYNYVNDFHFKTIWDNGNESSYLQSKCDSIGE